MQLCITKRLLLYLHFDRNRQVDPHVEYQLSQFAPLCVKIVFIDNSSCGTEPAAATETLARDNIGFDFGGWGEALAKLHSELSEYDELILMNSSCYGPLFPPEEWFAAMEKKECDFWGITSHPAMHKLPYHLQSNFLVIRRPMFLSKPFREFWRNIGQRCATHRQAVTNGELAFTGRMRRAGFRDAVLIEPADQRETDSIGHRHSFSYYSADWLIRRYRLPLVKIKAFQQGLNRHGCKGSKILRAIRESRSGYPVELLENHLRRTTPLSWHKNLPSTLLTISPLPPQLPPLRAAVILHVYYLEQLPAFLVLLERMPFPFDLYLTTPHRELADRPPNLPANARNCSVVLSPNRGRDIAPWLNALPPEKHLSYDLCLKLHTKSSPTTTEAFGDEWRDFLTDSLLHSEPYLRSILGEMMRNPAIGILIPCYPPTVTLQCPSAYAGHPADRLKAKQLLERLKLNPPAETAQPVFSAGTMFYYRPAALRRLFCAGINFDAFPAEPIDRVGSIAHALERLIPYIAQCEGFEYRQAIPPERLVEAFRTYEDRIMAPVTCLESLRQLRRSLETSLRYRLGK